MNNVEKFEHKPVMLEESLKQLNIIEDGVYVDCTVGGAGHSAEILKMLSKNGTLICIDRDINAVATARKRLKEIDSEAKLIIVKDNYERIIDILNENNIEKADGILFDLGVSSHQLDEEKRGFSYQKNSPLDMRMDNENQITAHKIINSYSQKELTTILRDYGEERWAVRIAEFIINERNKNTINSTGELVKIIKAAIPKAARRDGPHPAKRTFQAIRIAVNDELNILNKSLENAFSVLGTKGKICIISFHSLEDRIVKWFFRSKEGRCTCPKEYPVCVCGNKKEAEIITKRPILPKQEEVEANPRARSAKMRVLHKI